MAKAFDSRAKWEKREADRASRPGQPKPKKVKSKMSSNEFPFDISHLFSGIAPPAKPVAPPPPPVLWDDIIGQVEAKAAVREAIEGATKHAALYKRYGRRPTKGVLLFGPPGNGKTMLGKAAASSLAAQHGQHARDTGFIYVKGPEVRDMYVGGSERKIRALFARAREHKQLHGYPAVIFIDEAESALGHRDERSMSSVIVPAFLAEMDGMEDTGAFVLLATNRPGCLDSAVIREGRIDRKVLVDRPSREDAAALFLHGLRGRPVDGDATSLAASAVEALYDTSHGLYVVHLSDGTTKSVTLGAFTSGAQIAYLVDAAAGFAIEREIETGEESGIRHADFCSAVARTLRDQRELDHPAELVAFCEPLAGSVVRLERVRADGARVKRASLIAEIPEGKELLIVGMPKGETAQC